MTRRRRAAWAVLAFVAVWPAVTVVLQLGFDVDPWKLMAFGMYAAPARRPEDFAVSLTARRGATWEPLDLPEEENRFIRRRYTLGKLVGLGGLAQRALESSGADEVRAELQQFRLDASTARVVLHREVAVVSAR